ncbi:meiotic recombination protein REC8 homolog isoform X2 [Salmo trutta]|uniref:meiotic recombination protein REC8 homolog isoform X2 n=1 Tax=Salmo trutta TaxID=8032 RepID=UPI0011317A32|nr:meiotic recombination protein REC8 homolog isoform X2 [Salmo trutta]
MFFSPSVLNRHTGCFSTIWLAATKGIKIPRKDFLKVNVQRTCNDIMDYVLVRVPPPLPGLPRPRFSLYLSSQLQYGVIIVYHRQCGMLLEEIQHILDRLAKTRTAQKIDVDESDRHALSLPDVLSLLEESEWAANPFFGEIHSGYAMPSPNTLIQLGGEFRREATPERPLLLSPGSPPQEGITASPDSITLIETEPVTIPSAEFEGAELAEVTHQNMGMIDLLMDQLDHFPEARTPRYCLARRQSCPWRCLPHWQRRGPQCLSLCPLPHPVNQRSEGWLERGRDGEIAPPYRMLLPQ